MLHKGGGGDRALLHTTSAPERTRQAQAPALHVAKSASGRLERGQSLTPSEASAGKARKPYTITKQRERWTDAEHARFLEALRIHGRAWRRIEEHIGTKTAVQIRSHAQKFFSKLEREQAAGNISAIPEDLNIPPPRPKRKPSHPYPRKADPVEPPSHADSGSLPALAAAAAAATPSAHSGPPPSRGVSPSLQGPTSSNPGRGQVSPFSTIQQSRAHYHHPKVQQPSPQQQSHSGHAAAVAAVAAAASAAAAAAAAAVVAAAEKHIQASLQADPPKGFPFFGMPPAVLASMGLQLQTETQAAALEQLRLQATADGLRVGSLGTSGASLGASAGRAVTMPQLGLALPPGALLHPRNTALAGTFALHGFAEPAPQPQPQHVATLASLARLASTPGLSGLANQFTQTGQGHQRGPKAGTERTATSTPDARGGANTLEGDGSDELRRGPGGKLNASDGDSACSREQAAGAGAAAAAPAGAAAGLAPVEINFQAAAEAFQALRRVSGAASTANAAAAGWAQGLPLQLQMPQALCSAAVAATADGAVTDTGGSIPSSFAAAYNQATGGRPFAWGDNAGLVFPNGPSFMAGLAQPVKSSGGKGSAFTHASVGGRSQDGKQEARRRAEDNVPQKCSKAAGNGSGSNDSQISQMQADCGSNGNGSSGEGSNEAGNVNGSDDDNKGSTQKDPELAPSQGNGTSKAPQARHPGDPATADPAAGEAHARAAAQVRPPGVDLEAMQSGAGKLPHAASNQVLAGGSGGEDGSQGEASNSKGVSDDGRSSCTLPAEPPKNNLRATCGVTLTPSAAPAEVNAAPTQQQQQQLQLQQQQAALMQQLLAANPAAAAALAASAGYGSQGLADHALASLQQLSADPLFNWRGAGGGSAASMGMFAPAFGNFQAFVQQRAVAAASLQNQYSNDGTAVGAGSQDLADDGTARVTSTVSGEQRFGRMSGGGGGLGGTSLSGALGPDGGPGDASPSNKRTFSGGFQPYKPKAVPASAELKRSISESKIDMPPRKRFQLSMSGAGTPTGHTGQ